MNPLNPTAHSPVTVEALTRKHVTDALHSILREHMRLASARPRITAFHATGTQRNAELMQALTRAQRNL